MTFPQAIARLQDLAFQGDPSLIAATDCAPGLSKASVYRLISQGKVPAVKIGGTLKTTKELFEVFFKRSIVPAKTVQSRADAFAETRRREIQAAQDWVMGKR